MHKIEAHSRLERQHLQYVVGIDRECFNQEPSSTAFAWAELRPDMYNVLTFNEQVLGYGLIIPVTAFACEALKRGEMSEEELTLKYITSASRCDGLYLASMASTKRAGAIIRSRLVGYTMGNLLRAPKEVFTIAVTTDGASIARELVGMSPSQYTGPVRLASSSGSVVVKLLPLPLSPLPVARSCEPARQSLFALHLCIVVFSCLSLLTL